MYSEYTSDEQRRMGANPGATLRDGFCFRALLRLSLLMYFKYTAPLVPCTARKTARTRRVRSTVGREGPYAAAPAPTLRGTVSPPHPVAVSK